MWSRITFFFEEARVEFRHVNWPTRAEAARLTGVVIGIALGLAAFLGFFDWLFTNIIKSLIIK